MVKRSNHQGGWVTSFIVVGVLLFVALLGGIYFLKHRPSSNNQVAKNGSSKTEKQLETKKPEAKSHSEDKTSHEKPSTATTPSTNHSSSSHQQAEVTPSNDKSSASNLPTTGPEDVIIKALVVSLLGFAIVSYARSCRLSLVTRV